MSFSVTTLDASTWDVFAELGERNNGIYGGCRCIAFHPAVKRRDLDHDYRPAKQEPVRTDRACAALVLDQHGKAQGWAQYGSGLVEVISEVTEGREAQGRFLFSARVEVYDDRGFDRIRHNGKHAWIVSRLVTGN